jgi:hypothetical protein
MFGLGSIEATPLSSAAIALEIAPQQADQDLAMLAGHTPSIIQERTMLSAADRPVGGLEQAKAPATLG